ncbi:MAG: pyridoxal phosphate-dependent aminotransferase [Bryobacterales bacterium]|nr:pyridoxal phosphate-dependent aminotransferase [Bryobacterales bacterium]
MSAALSASARSVAHSRIRELAEIAMTMDGVAKLYFGESNIPTPAFIRAAAARAMEEGFTYYTSNAGLESTRQAMAAYYEAKHGVALNPAHEIVVTASGVQALNVAIRCTLDPGDEALILTPAWPNGASIVQMCNAMPVMMAQPLATSPSGAMRYTIDFDALEAAVTPRTRLLLYTSPSNPLGWVATADEQRRLLEFTRRHKLWLLADEVYERLWYEGPALGAVAPSILRLATRDDSVIVAQSFSKSYCMTGWRLGWIVARTDLAARACELNEFIISHAASFSQRAAETALRDGEPFILAMLEQFRANRDFCLDVLRSLPGVTVPEPGGAFYLFPRISGLADSFAFCKRLLVETKVGLAPGVAFGAGGEGSVRLCYASERSVVEPAMERLAAFIGRGAWE